MQSLVRAVCSPGARGAVSGIAPSQPVLARRDESAKHESHIEVSDQGSDYAVQPKKRRLDRWLDNVVAASGSAPVFFIIQIGLIAWALLGVPFHDTTIWPVIISDVQAIFSYVFDSFLMRQQLNGYDEFLGAIAALRSRLSSNRRMILQVSSSLEVGDGRASLISQVEVADQVSNVDFPVEKRFSKIITVCSHVVGHVMSIAIYWISIFVWLGFGRMNDWSVEWQLDINSATSALMVFVFSFLAIVREEHSRYSRRCLQAISKVDADLERKLRAVTGDQLTNPEVFIEAPNVNMIQRGINYYADVVGTLVGIVILIAAIIAWLVIGPILHFDSDWWLIIGTYAGLIGMNDGFVLRNIQANLLDHEIPNFALLEEEDVAVFEELELSLPPKEKLNHASLSNRISLIMGRVCSHEITVVLGFLVIVGLLAGASAMRWSTTGQLLCNIPPSIIESFFMVILITGHNIADAQRRVDLLAIYQRRLKLLAFANAVAERASPEEGREPKPVGEQKDVVSIPVEGDKKGN